jgi:hypothetical protein
MSPAHLSPDADAATYLFARASFGFAFPVVVRRGRGVDSGLLHQFCDGSLQIVDAVTHFVDSPYDRRAHLIKAVLLRD